jgi:hypothetical protein
VASKPVADVSNSWGSDFDYTEDTYTG